MFKGLHSELVTDMGVKNENRTLELSKVHFFVVDDGQKMNRSQRLFSHIHVLHFSRNVQIIFNVVY